MNRVSGKVAIVTGGAVGIGKATCELLSKEGATVVVADIKDKEGQTLADRLAQTGSVAAFRHLDVSSEPEIRDVMRSVSNEFGRIDILVNNAGITGPKKPTHEISIEEWQQVIAYGILYLASDESKFVTGSELIIDGGYTCQ